MGTGDCASEEGSAGPGVPCGARGGRGVRSSGEAWAAGRPHGTRSGQQDVTALFREFRLGALLRISIE